MATSKKFYVVWVGAQPGIYTQWNQCEAQIKGYPGARYKSFTSKQEAEAAFAQAPPTPQPKQKTTLVHRTAFEPRSLAVDAACSGNPGVMEYQGVYTQTNARIFHQKFPLGTNNIGEFLGIVHALAYLKQHNELTMPVYSDSVNAIKWVKQKKCKTTLPENQKTEKLYEVIRRAEQWLRDNTYTNPILKWETKQWGEIPADFGRK